jgi:hypothetical protein
VKTNAIGCLVLCGVASTGCATNVNRQSYQPGATSIPWQLTPASTASEAQGEKTTVIFVPKFGWVRGTEVGLANFSKAMKPYPGAHAVVRPCRNSLQAQATRIGAYSMEAAAAGPERHLRNGIKRQQVFFRIFYRTINGIEVRQAALICTLDARTRTITVKPV